MGLFLAMAVDPDPIWIVPFALLLLAIAVMPFVHKHGWEAHYPKVAIGLGALTTGYYLLALHDGERVLHAGIEYLGFIALIASLFVVAGGIHLAVPEGGATPLRNAAFLAAGAVLANVIGTTGASMLLIRPWMRFNAGRTGPLQIVFFIFLVSNLGGCLTPVGDPPLFLGYLKKIPFFWTLTHLWGEWLFGVAALLALYFVLETVAFRREGPRPAATGRWRVTGKVNFLFLAAILGAIFLPEPWRELTMAAAGIGSWFATPRRIHQANGFDFEPVKEVAWLFAGIFLTMMPAIDWISGHAEKLGIDTPGKFYWITGGLSGFLDNAPTYLTFLSACLGLHGRSLDVPADVLAELAEHGAFVAAISLGAVFFGAITYIGNGPNFMVKAIAEQAGVRTPGFFGYFFRYAVPFLLPVLFLTWLIFLR